MRELLFPRLRDNLDISFHRFEDIPDQEFIVFRCPLGLLSQPFVLNRNIGPLLAMFDGKRSVNEIVAQHAKVGATYPLVNELVQLLNQNHLLETDLYRAHRDSSFRQFLDNPIRPPALAGRAYPAAPMELSKQIQGFVPDSPPRIPLSAELTALMVPHIDYHRGGAAYGVGYNEYRSRSLDCIILLGTAHQASPYLFHLTRKDFSSPLGTLKNDHSFTDSLANRYGIVRSYADEYLHRQEHSLELQLPFLCSQLQHGKLPQIVPILVGSFHPYIQQERAPQESGEYQDFAGSLSELVSSRVREGQSVHFLAGVDMAHVGTAFGDPKPLTPDYLEYVRARDLLYLNLLIQRDPQPLFQHIAEDGDARRICGFPTMYTVLDVLNRIKSSCKAHLLDYQQAVDSHTDTCVTFGVMAFSVESPNR